jgi:hypothetical protein
MDSENRTWYQQVMRVRDPQFLVSPYFIRSLIASSAFSYGVFSISACLLLKRKLPVNRGYFISIPAFSGLLGWSLTQEDPIFVYTR